MTCSCKETDDKKECPEGQSFDVSQGKCVSKENVKEEFGSPGVDQKADLSDSGPDTGEDQKVTNHECPPGHSYDSTTEKCMPTSPEVPAIADTKADISKESRIKELENTVAELKMKEKKPTATVGDSDNSVKSFKEIAKEYPRALAQYGTYKFTIPYNTLRGIKVGRADPKTGLQEAFRNSPAQIQEAVTLSGTHATQDLDTDVAIIPGGISFVPVFQFAKVKEIAAGADRARFFKSTLPSNGTQTVGSTPAEATQTITSVEVTPSTITGTYLIGDFDEIENSPFDLLQVIVEGSSASYEDFVATDMLDTISKEGTLSPGLWIRADTGATATTVRSTLQKLFTALQEDPAKVAKALKLSTVAYDSFIRKVREQPFEATKQFFESTNFERT